MVHSNLSMSDHITKTCSATFYHLYNTRRIRQHLTKECTETLIHTFITSHLDYCNSLLHGSPDYLLNKLQRVQNAAARIIFKESKYCHVTPLLRTLHWLPVVYHIQFKILLLTFKAIHGNAPSYISDLISVKDNYTYSLRSSNSTTLNYSSICPSNTLDDRSFHMAAPKIWNGLPSNICLSLVHSFKKALKIFFYLRVLSICRLDF